MSWLSKAIGAVGKALGGGQPQFNGITGAPPGFNPSVPSSPLVKTPTNTGSIFDGVGIGLQPAGSPGTYRTDGLGVEDSQGWKDYMEAFAAPLVSAAGTALADKLFGDEPTNTPLAPNTANPGGAPAGSPTGSVGDYAPASAASVDWGVQLGSGSGLSTTTLLLVGGVMVMGAVLIARGGR